MITPLEITKDWLVSTCEGGEFQFARSQLELLRSFFDDASVDQLSGLIARQLETLQDREMIQLSFPPFQLILFRSGDCQHVAIAGKSPRVNPSFAELAPPDGESCFLAESPVMKRLMEIVKKVSSVDSTVLLLGGSGVGKGAVAKLIHKYSKRVAETFISVNCGAIPEPLMEAELFGYESGSFTGGHKDGKKGLFETATGGTIFLDEIGELPLNLQVKLLEVLQEKQIRRVGGTVNIPVDVRIIAATNRDLKALVEQGNFREDLYYRLHVVPIEIPPLKERREDIRPLLDYFLKKYANMYKTYKVLHPDVYRLFLQYDWPGNVRELENMVERLVITTEEAQIRPEHLPSTLHAAQTRELPSLSLNGIIPIKQAKKLVEAELVKRAYTLYKSTYKAAKVLGVNQSTVAKKLKEFRENGW